MFRCDDMSWRVCKWWHAVTRRQCGVVTLAPSLTCTHHPWWPHHMPVINVQPLYASTATKSDSEEKSRSKLSWGIILFIHLFELWESLFPCDIPRSQCSEYVTFHVGCTGVQTACTPSVQVYTPSRTIHSVVRRPQRGQHPWYPHCESQWNNEILRYIWKLSGSIL